MHHRSYPIFLLAGIFLFILLLSLAGCVENMNSAGKPKNSADIIKPETEFTVSDSWSFKQYGKEDTFDVSGNGQTPRPSRADSPDDSPGLNLGSHFNFDALDSGNTEDASYPTDLTETSEMSEQSEVADSSDTDNTGADTDINPPEPPTTPPTVAPSSTMTYSTMEYGFAFDYPASWKKLQDEGGKIVFSVEKIVDNETTSASDRATIIVTWFEKWTSDFPLGSEKMSVKGQNLMLVDLDTDGPFGRDYYRKIGKSGALKMSIIFEPGYSIELETESAGWKNYLDASENFRKEVFQEYLDMILSVKEDI